MRTIITVILWLLVILMFAWSLEGCKKGSPSDPNIHQEEKISEEVREYEGTEDQEMLEEDEPNKEALPEGGEGTSEDTDEEVRES